VRLAAVVLVAACHPQEPTTGVLPTDAIVSIHSNVRDAELFVDGRDVGPLLAERGGVALVPGFHRLELELGRAERKKVAMDMSPILP
jgi:hypothetical protein